MREPTSRRALRSRATIAASAVALLLVWASGAFADIVYNEAEDPISIDATLEVVSISTSGGSQQVTISVTATDANDAHTSCNIEGNGNNKLVLSVNNSNPAVATVSPSTLTFNDCDSGDWQEIVTVTAVSNGSTIVSFSIHPSTSNSVEAGQRTWTLNTASFQVDVSNQGGGNGGGNELCTDPAAPAWAAHILGKQKKKVSGATNYVAQVAHHMGPGTDFESIQKTDHDAYEQAVLAFLKTATGNGTLALPAGWPPNQCQTITVL